MKSDAVSGQDSLPVVQNTACTTSQDLGEQTQHLADEKGEHPETTVFVNAANYPMGALAVREGVRLNMFGGPGFQPVVVDLKE
jgi:hypothetical protein